MASWLRSNYTTYCCSYLYINKVDRWVITLVEKWNFRFMFTHHSSFQEVRTCINGRISLLLCFSASAGKFSLHHLVLYSSIFACRTYSIHHSFPITDFYINVVNYLTRQRKLLYFDRSIRIVYMYIYIYSYI